MKDKEFADVYGGDFLRHWTEIVGFRKPIVAAVSGYAVCFPLPVDFKWWRAVVETERNSWEEVVNSL